MLAVYAILGFFTASSQLTGFHDVSSYTVTPAAGLSIATNDEVSTILLTDGAYALADFKTPVVPLIAGSSMSVTGSLNTDVNGDAVWMM